MTLKCAFGLHRWSGCKCSVCAKVRNEGHNWSKDCETCAKCATTRSGSHAWNGCKCSNCGKIRNEGHDWGKDCETCAKCGTKRARAHEWTTDNERCSRCGAQNPNALFDLGCACALESLQGGDASKVIRIFEQAARAGHTDAKHMLGLFLARSGDLRGAYTWISSAEEDGSKGAAGSRRNIKFLMDNQPVMCAFAYTWGPKIPPGAPSQFKLTKDPLRGQIFVVD